jgi:hypothetical protein
MRIFTISVKDDFNCHLPSGEHTWRSIGIEGIDETVLGVLLVHNVLVVSAGPNLAQFYRNKTHFANNN